MRCETDPLGELYDIQGVHVPSCILLLKAAGSLTLMFITIMSFESNLEQLYIHLVSQEEME